MIRFTIIVLGNGTGDPISNSGLDGLRFSLR